MATPSQPLHQDSVVVRWNNAALEAVRATRLGPPMVARALSVLHTCIYDAWAAYDAAAIGTRTGDLLRRPPAERTAANKFAAISFAAHRALTDLFPTEAERFNTLLGELGFTLTGAAGETFTPRAVGNAAAQAVIRLRHGDGANQLGDRHPGAYSDYTGYQPVNDPDNIRNPNRWQPLRVPDGHGAYSVQQYVAPHWGMVLPFALSSASQFRPAGPRSLPVDTDEYRQQAVEILNYSAGLTDRHKVIAEYWADGPGTETPPGHWCLFGQFVSRRDRHDLDRDVKLFFALTGALFDASIACWEAKRAFDSERPVTAIHWLFRGQQVRAWRGPGRGAGLIDGGSWQPYQEATVITPAFPEFCSGHSAFSAAAAEILRRFTGSDAFGASHTQRAGSSFVEPGKVPAADLTLTWATFSDAAAEAGISRRYGGIHFAEADLAGRALGRAVAAVVWERVQALLTPAPLSTARP